VLRENQLNPDDGAGCTAGVVLGLLSHAKSKTMSTTAP
jgi:hypothetical protein